VLYRSHTSRFARNQIEARRYKQLLRERLGIRVVSVSQPMGEDHTDPSAFLAESIHEMFDEYYSVSLSFWTRSGLKEKARQGHLVGSLPWGYLRDPDTKIAVPDPLGRRSCSSCSSAMPPARSPTARSPLG
jgi:DNA invertase Pin-like site-specific DNA recombinase